MAVVDGRQQLLHDDGGVVLVELGAVDDLVEELAALANLGHEVEALLVLEVLVHLDDVGVVHVLEDHDLVLQHLDLLRVQQVLAQHLHGALALGGLVEAQPHLAEGALSEHLADAVVVADLAVRLADEGGGTDSLCRLATPRPAARISTYLAPF